MVIFLPLLKHVWDTESECATLSVINFAGNLVHVRSFLSCFATHFSALIPWVRHIWPAWLEQQIFDSLMVHSTSARNVQVVAVHCVCDSAAACCMHFFSHSFAQVPCYTFGQTAQWPFVCWTAFLDQHKLPVLSLMWTSLAQFISADNQTSLMGAWKTAIVVCATKFLVPKAIPAVMKHGWGGFPHPLEVPAVSGNITSVRSSARCLVYGHSPSNADVPCTAVTPCLHHMAIEGPRRSSALLQLKIEGCGIAHHELVHVVQWTARESNRLSSATSKKNTQFQEICGYLQY